MRTSKLGIAGILCAAALLWSCGEPVPTVENDRFKKLYLSAANDDAKSIILLTARDTSFVFGRVTYGGTTCFEQGDITAEIAADFSLVNSYNTNHNTAYEPLPDECFTFGMTTLVIGNGNNYSGSATLFLSPGKLDTEKEYLLPVVMQSVTGTVAVDEEKKTAYWAFGFRRSSPPLVLKDIYPLELLTGGMNQIDLTSSDGVTTLKTIGADPNLYTSTLGRPLSDGIKRVIAFEYISNRTVTNTEFFYCVAGGPEGGKSSGEAITIPQASEWTRFEFDLSTAINSFGFGVDNSGGREPADHFFRFDPTGDAGYEISIRNFQIEIYSDEPVDDETNFAKYNWTVVSASSEWNTTAQSILDGNSSSFWHTDSQGNMPQWAIIDMKKSLTLHGIKLWNRQDDHGCEPKNIVFEVSDDMENWKLILNEPEMSNDWEHEVDLPMANPQRGRYLRITVKSNWGNAPYTYIAEITPY
jgi:hypothetical protein